MFKVGQKVVCVDDNYPKAHVFIQRQRIIVNKWEFPRKDEIYTVREVFPETITVEEIHNRIDAEFKKEPRFFFYHFRPLDEVVDEVKLEENYHSRYQEYNIK